MKIAEKTLNYVKSLTAQAISNAKSGHTGASLGVSAIMLALFKDHYTFDVSDTDFLNRDYIRTFLLDILLVCEQLFY